MFLEFLFDISYRLSFKLSKCESFDPRVEYLGHDLTSSGNCPAKYKFNMIRDWTLPVHGTPLLLFIGMCIFYACFSPWFEINLKLLRILQRRHHRKDISEQSWTPYLVKIFDKCKNGITSSSVWHDTIAISLSFLRLAGRLKAWDTFSCTLIIATTIWHLKVLVCGQFVSVPVPIKSMKSIVIPLLAKRLVDDGLSRIWSDMCGVLLYWMCDCTAVKDILEYNGSSHQFRRWC